MFKYFLHKDYVGENLQMNVILFLHEKEVYPSKTYFCSYTFFFFIYLSSISPLYFHKCENIVKNWTKQCHIIWEIGVLLDNIK